MATSDLGGRRPKGENHLGSRRKCKRGTPGPLLPPKANSRSQSSGLEPATACLEGRRSRSRRSLDLHRHEGRFHTIFVHYERPGKRCRLILLMISAKGGAKISRQAVTLLSNFSLLSSALTTRQRKDVLPIPIYVSLKNRYTQEAGQGCISCLKQEPGTVFLLRPMEKDGRISGPSSAVNRMVVPAMSVPIAQSRQLFGEGEGQSHMSKRRRVCHGCA